MVFGLGVLISDQFFITAARLVDSHVHNDFNQIYIKLAMPFNAGPRYNIEKAVINSYAHINLQERNIDYAVLRVSYFMHEILKLE